MTLHEYMELPYRMEIEPDKEEESKREEISMNQYCLYLLSRNDAIHSQG